MVDDEIPSEEALVTSAAPAYMTAHRVHVHLALSVFFFLPFYGASRTQRT